MSSKEQAANTNQDNGQIQSIEELRAAVAELKRDVRALEDRTFIGDILDSSSRDSGIPAGHTDAFHGGALYDETRNMIISVSQDSNKCRDVHVTHLGDRRTEVRKNIIPFDCQFRVPMYDGQRFVYFTERARDNDDSVCGRRFGRMDLESLTFEELPPLPAEPFKTFAGTFHGCYHHGVIFMSDDECQICGYDIESGVWRRYGITLPIEGERWKHGTLLSDPNDEHHLYLLGSYSKPGLYRIDFKSFTCTLLSLTPGTVKCYDAVLVRSRPESSMFAIVAKTGEKWHMYSSKSNKWKALDWKGPGISWSRDFLVYCQKTKTFYYHIHGQPTWEMVQL